MEIIFSIDDLDTLKNVCQANKHALSICRRYRVTLCKKFLKRYQVDYNDPDNFIYVQNNVKKEDYFSENGDPNYCELFRLYSKFYDNKEIIFKSRYDGKISSMPLFPNLDTLDCSSHNLTSLPNGMVNLKNLSCSSNKLKSLPNDMVSLIELNCEKNELTILPTGLLSLKILQCGHNPLSSLPNVFQNLTFLSCVVCQLTSLPKDLHNLTTLICVNNELTSLPNGRTNLNKLYCGVNLLTFLPNDLNNVEYLTCADNSLTDLPTNMNKLILIRIRGNQFTDEILASCNTPVSGWLMYNDIDVYQQFVKGTLKNKLCGTILVIAQRHHS